MRKTSNTDTLIEEVLDYEKNRYIRKGYGLIMANIITVAWFLILPKMINIIWPYRIQDEGVFLFFSSYITHEATFILVNFIMWIIYNLEWSFFERYKVLDRPWPWKENPEKWRKMIKKTILVLFVNQVLIVPVLGINYYLKNVSPYRTDYESFPSSFEIIWQTVIFMLVEDFFFYWSHRFLHWDKIYPYFHKIHHQYVYSVSIASEYAHPVDYVFSSVLPSNIGPLVLGKRVHLATFLLWVVLRVAETTDGHSGYEFSWSPFRLLPMSGSSEYHHYHHVSFKGNYSSFFTYLDRIFGTVNNRYIEFAEKKKGLITSQENKMENMKEINEKKNE